MKATILKKFWSIASAGILRQSQATCQNPDELDHKVNDLQDPQIIQQQDEEQNSFADINTVVEENDSEESEQNSVADIDMVVEENDSEESEQNCVADIDMVVEENDSEESEQNSVADIDMVVEENDTEESEQNYVADIDMVEEENESEGSEQEQQELKKDLILSEFDFKFPYGMKDSVVFYTTSLRGIRETFDACNRIKFLLDSYKISYKERDVSFDSDYRQELRTLLGTKVIPPRLFIKGKYIGGADEVTELNEQEQFRKILEGIPLADSKCDLCGNERFLICSVCNGSSKVIPEDESDEMWEKCWNCNEHGLVKCPVCG